MSTGLKANSDGLTGELQVNGSTVLSAVAAGISIPGTLTVTGVTQAANGTVGSPGITFTSDTDSGIYRIGANNIGIGVNGAKVLDVSTTGLGVTGTLLLPDGSVSAVPIRFTTSGANTGFYNSGSNSFDAAINGTYRTRWTTTGFEVNGKLKASGPSNDVAALFVGASGNYAMQVSSDTSTASQCAIFILNPTSTSSPIDIWNKNTSGDNIFQYFFTESSATLRGSITYNRGGGVVAYNTTSDYRAKTVYGPLQDTGAVIDALKVYRGKMNGATVERPMMIAHEAQEVVPYAVNGEKDELDEKGNPKYQTMDHQILVPLLIAEVQALRARVAALEAK